MGALGNLSNTYNNQANTQSRKSYIKKQQKLGCISLALSNPFPDKAVYSERGPIPIYLPWVIIIQLKTNKQMSNIFQLLNLQSYTTVCSSFISFSQCTFIVMWFVGKYLSPHQIVNSGQTEKVSIFDQHCIHIKQPSA